ncbi:MAG: FAD-binding oxidoreductase [Roseiflexaceae bacterium]|nr:FAD-binding oxidoreductase [Roseiflexaceae bacterium]
MAADQQADIVIIGGGIFGCSAAYHLRKAGVGRVVLLEREPDLAARTSAAAAGFISLWSAFNPDPDPTLSIERYGLQFYQALARSHQIGLNQVGIAHVATTPITKQHLSMALECVQQRAAEQAVWLTAEDLCEIAPIITSTRIAGALYMPGAFSLNAQAAVQALARELVDMGVDIRTSTPACSIQVSAGSVAGVTTATGLIATTCVIDAAGAWVGSVAQSAGVHIPLVALEASRFVTEPIAEVPPQMPMLMFSDYHNLYVRAESGGLLIGSEEIVIHPPTLRAGLGYALGLTTQPGPDRGGGLGRSIHADATHTYHLALARAFADVVPVLGACTVREVRTGLPTRTPDMQHLLGGIPGVSGLYLIGADLECGMTRGPGLGRLLAELITTGTAQTDSIKYQPDRWLNYIELSRSE